MDLMSEGSTMKKLVLNRVRVDIRPPHPIFHSVEAYGARFSCSSVEHPIRDSNPQILKPLIKTHRKVLKTSNLAYTILLVQG